MPVDQDKKTADPNPGAAAPIAADPLHDPLASWIQPTDPSASPAPGFLNPDSAINPLNVNVAKMEGASDPALDDEVDGPAALSPGLVPIGLGASGKALEFPK